MTFRRVQVRRFARVTLGKMLQSQPVSDLDVERPYLRAAHVQSNGRVVNLDDDQVMWFRPSELRDLDLRSGDVVIVEGGAGYGRSGLIRDGHSGWGFQNSIVRVRPFPDLSHGPFVDYALQSALAEGRIALVASTATIPHFTAEKVAAFPIPRPPLVEQRAIADFLDRETAEIDLLIEKQSTLIDRLRERRSEVISHGVRIGLNPEVTLIPSRVHWIGRIPAHWTSPQLRRLADMTSGAGFPVEEQGLEDEQYPFYKVNALARADDDGMIRARYDTVSGGTARKLRAAVVPAGSLVLAKIGAALLLGRVRVLAFDSCVDNNMLAISPKPGVVTRFLYYALQDVRMDLLVNPGAVPSLSEKWFRAYQLPLPPLHEQQQIADHLDRETAKIDELIAKTERFIELTRERRSALITAAVTGQIAVTGRRAV